MFRKSPPQEEAAPRVERRERNEQSFLQHGVRIDGDIHADGDLRIDGQVKGTLTVGGTLTAGPKSSIVATIKSRSLVIHGSLDGVVQAEERIHLSRGAKVRADLYCQSLVIDEGVFFHGRSHMGETTTAAPEAQPAAARPELSSAGRHESLPPIRREPQAALRPDAPAMARPEITTTPKTDPYGAGRVEPSAPPRPDASSSRPLAAPGPGAEPNRMVPDPLRRGLSGPAATSPRTPDGPAKPSTPPTQGPASGVGIGAAQPSQSGAEPKPSPAGTRPATGPGQGK
jgi:cytoskeletal protein CcmA (bactofilin family)